MMDFRRLVFRSSCGGARERWKRKRLRRRGGPDPRIVDFRIAVSQPRDLVPCVMSVDYTNNYRGNFPNGNPRLQSLLPVPMEFTNSTTQILGWRPDHPATSRSVGASGPLRLTKD